MNAAQPAGLGSELLHCAYQKANLPLIRTPTRDLNAVRAVTVN
jgi:hypothetical protein